MQRAREGNVMIANQWPQAPTSYIEIDLANHKRELAVYLTLNSDDIQTKRAIAFRKDHIFMSECYLKHRRGGAKSAPNVQPNKNSRNTQQQPDKLPDIPEPTGDVSKCRGPHNELSAEFERRKSTVDTDDIVVNLAMLHWIGPQMRDIWQTCDAAVAQAYEKLSVKALEMCLPRTSDPRLCKDPFATRVASSAQPTRGSSDQDPAVESGGGYAIKKQKPKKTTLSPAARKALERAAVASQCVKMEPWAVDGVEATNTCWTGRPGDGGLSFFGV